MGGFIVGFDNDPASIFKTQINFIQKSGIVTAMVGLLNAPRGTRLYQRLKSENRLTQESSGNNTDFSLNFIPKMNPETLIRGYQEILNTIYAPKNYYARIKTLMQEYHPPSRTWDLMDRWAAIRAFVNCMWFNGIREKGRIYYWSLMASTLFTQPRSIPLFVTHSVYGYHFRRVIRQYIPGFNTVKA